MKRWLIHKGECKLALEIFGENERLQLEFYADGRRIARILQSEGKGRMTSFNNNFVGDEIHSYMQCVILSSVICKEWKHFLENPKEFIMRQWWVFKEEIKS